MPQNDLIDEYGKWSTKQQDIIRKTYQTFPAAPGQVSSDEFNQFGPLAVHRLHVKEIQDDIKKSLEEWVRSYKAIYFQRLDDTRARGLPWRPPPPVNVIKLIENEAEYLAGTATRLHIETIITNEVYYSLPAPTSEVQTYGPAVLGEADPNNPGYYFVGHGDRMLVKADGVPEEAYTAFVGGKIYHKVIAHIFLRYVEVKQK